jgi:hypothetical protein
LVSLYEREKDMASRFTGIISEAFKRGEAPLYFLPPSFLKEGGLRGIDSVRYKKPLI